MDPKLQGIIQQDVEPFNRVIVDGFAVREAEKVEAYVDSIWRSAEKRFPEKLKYKGYTRCTPLEEYHEVTRKRQKQTFELSQSDVYMVRYHLEWDGKPLPTKCMYLPYVSQAGTMRVYGSTYTVSPVLADVVFSVVKDTVFIPLPCAKLTFERISHSYFANELVQTNYVPCSGIHNQYGKGAVRNGGTGPGTNIDGVTSLVHYFFCKYGFTQTFERFIGTVPLLNDGPFDSNKFPMDEWVICRSIGGMKPKGLKVSAKTYVPSNIHLAIRKEDFTPIVREFIASFFYILDYFPDRILPEPEYVDETRLWRILLAKFIWNGNSNEGKLSDEIDSHIRSLDDYIDPEAQQILADGNIFVEDFYEFCFKVMLLMGDLIRHTDTSDMYDKRLTVLRYLMFDIVTAIFKFSWVFNNAKKEFTEKDIINAMNAHLKPDLILNIRKDHGECSNITTPGDNYFFRMTSNLVLQADATPKGRRNSKSSVSDPSKLLSASIVEVGSYRNLPKAEPTGRTRANPRVQIASDGTIVRDESRRELLDGIQKQIQR